MGDKDLIYGVVVGFLIVGLIFVTMHDRHYQNRGNKILLNRVQTLEEIVSEWTN
jgi:hypothetical protein